MKTMSLRLDDALARDVEVAARADQIPVSEFIREAIDSQIANRRQDKEFRARLRDMMDDDREILERLAR